MRPEGTSLRIAYRAISNGSNAVPPLTTVHQPLTEMAVTAAAMVVKLAQGQPLAQTWVELATELVVRDSTAPPRS